MRVSLKLQQEFLMRHSRSVLQECIQNPVTFTANKIPRALTSKKCKNEVKKQKP